MGIWHSSHYRINAACFIHLVGRSSPLAGRLAGRGLSRPMTSVAFTAAARAFTAAGLGRHNVIVLCVAGAAGPP